MANLHNRIWTEERVEQLKRLHAEGLSCSLIAAELGCAALSLAPSLSLLIGAVLNYGRAELRNKRSKKTFGTANFLAH